MLGSDDDTLDHLFAHIPTVSLLYYPAAQACLRVSKIYVKLILTTIHRVDSYRRVVRNCLDARHIHVSIYWQVILRSG